jgi:hypothetical protein
MKRCNVALRSGDDQMRLEIERVLVLKKELEAINRADLREIELIERGSAFAIRADVIEEWRKTGLTNVDFIELRFWESSS